MGKGLLPRLRITAPTGSTVTASWQSKTVTLSEVEEGIFEADVPALAPWEVTATLDEDSKTVVVDVTDVARFEGEIDFIPEVLNDATWEQISQVSSRGVGDTYWDIGDAKAVTLNGTVGICTFSNETYYAFIIGFNHNSTLEGDNRIHFQFGKTALSGGTDICFIDSSYGSNVTTAAFHMKNSTTNSGGWNSSYMRNTICGTSLSSYSGTFIAALPSDLRFVLKTVTKYTDNTGGGSTSAANVTATTDVIFLLAEYEVFGTIARANTNESAKQAQYAYYSAGNSKVKYRHSSTGLTASWWLRSPRSTDSNSLVIVSTSGTDSSSTSATGSRGFVPGFCV